MYNFVLFDADDTLFDYDKGEYEALKNTFNDFTLEFDAEFHIPLYQKINKNVWDDFERNLISADNLKVKRFSELLKQCNYKENAKDFSDKYLANLAECHFLLDGAEDVVKAIYGKAKLAIITNGLSAVQHRRISLSKIARYITDIIVSEDIGFAKPDSKIFEYAFEKVNHSEKGSAIIVGDNLNSDILGGINFGIDTCWLNKNGIQNKSGIRPTFEISKISEFRELFFKK